MFAAFFQMYISLQIFFKVAIKYFLIKGEIFVVLGIMISNGKHIPFY